jgi:signal transduction histidine kinase
MAQITTQSLESFVKTLCNSIELGIIVIDHTFCIQQWNQWIALQTQTKPQEAVGQILTTRYPCLKERGLTSYLNQVFETQTAVLLSPVFHRYFIPVRIHNNNHMIQHTRLIPLRETNSTTSIIILIEDYTERFHYENTLSQQNAELDLERQKLLRAIEDLKEAQQQLIETEKLNALLEITGATAHELSQPLSAVVGCLQLALNQTPETHENYALLSNATEGATRMVDLLRKMKTIKTYQTKKYLDQTRIVDLDKSSKSSLE